MRLLLRAVLVCLPVAFILLAVAGCTGGTTADLVLYCAHDAAHAEAVIRKFEQLSGLSVDVRFDEEASKSLGLTNLLIAEKDNPRCDVFWNNQTLGTIRLMQTDVLQPYVSPNAERIPDSFRDTSGYWTGFAARLRVYIINTDQMDATEEAVQEMLAADSLSRVAIAQPMFGTTLSHYSVLAHTWGLEKLQQWHHDLHTRGIREARGNSVTRDLVAEGVCDLAFTDTDDAFGAIDAGKPVTQLPVRLEDGATICLPNSVAMIANCPHPDHAKLLIDFLLSEETELLLAESDARQIPLGSVDETRIPDDVRELQRWARDGIDIKPAADVNQAVLDWLQQEYTGQ